MNIGLYSFIAFIILWIYTGFMIAYFGIPESYSATFYKLNNIRKGLGILFPIMNIIIVALILPSWFYVSDNLLPNYTWLAFIATGGLLFVCASPFFKEYNRDTGKPLQDLIYRSFHGQGLVHTIGALLAMIGSIVWISMTPFFWLPIAWFILAIINSIATMTFKECIVFWVEATIYTTMTTFMIFISKSLLI